MLHKNEAFWTPRSSINKFKGNPAPENSCGKYWRQWIKRQCKSIGKTLKEQRQVNTQTKNWSWIACEEIQMCSEILTSFGPTWNFEVTAKSKRVFLSYQIKTLGRKLWKHPSGPEPVVTQFNKTNCWAMQTPVPHHTGWPMSCCAQIVRGGSSFGIA